LGSSTAFSASEVAMAMEELASAGFNTDQIMNSTAGVLDLAASSGIGLADAARITGVALNGFGLEADQSGRVADVLAKSAAISAADAMSMGEAFKYVAPLAQTLGLSIEETSAAIGIMADAGIDGSQAGTALRGGLSNLINPAGQSAKAMEELGWSAYDSNGKFKDLGTIIAELQGKTAGMTEEQKNQTLAMLFGQEAGAGWLSLLSAGSGELDKNTEALKNSSGEADKMAKVMQDNLAGAFEQLMGALESLAISFSDVLKGGLTTLAGWLTKLVNYFEGTSEGTKKFVVVLGLLAAAIAPLLITIGLIGQGIGALVIAFGAVSAPVLAVIAVLVAVGAAFVALYAKSETFRTGVQTVFTAIKDLITQAMSAVVTFLQEKFAQIKQFWDENGAQILQAVQNVWNAIAPIVDIAMNLVLMIIQGIWNAIKNVINGALNVIMGLVKVFAGLFTGDFSKMWEGVKQLFMGAIELIWGLMNLSFYGKIIQIVKNLVKGFINLIKGQWDNIQILFMMGKDKVVSILNALKSAGTKVWNAIKDFVVNLVKALWNQTKSNFNAMKSGITTIFNAIKSVASSVWNGIKSVISTVVNAVKSVVMSVWNAIKSNTQSAFNTIKSVASSVWNGIKSVITTVANAVKSAVQTAWNTLKSLTSSAFNAIKSVASSVWNGIKSTISSVVNGIRSTVSSVFNGIKSTVSSVFNSIKSTATSVWNGVKNAIVNPIKSAKSTVLGIIDAIKGAFSAMKITIPKPKLPKISVKKKTGIMGIPYPDFDVSWNAKGGIFNGATLLGGGQGVGEAGAEAVLPIQHKRYMKPFASAVADQLPRNNDDKVVEVHNTTTTIVELDGKEVGRSVETSVSRQQAQKQKRRR
jgi:TP901 family phage tail tape measure protein